MIIQRVSPCPYPGHRFTLPLARVCVSKCIHMPEIRDTKANYLCVRPILSKKEKRQKAWNAQPEKRRKGPWERERERVVWACGCSGKYKTDAEGKVSVGHATNLTFMLLRIACDTDTDTHTGAPAPARAWAWAPQLQIELQIQLQNTHTHTHMPSTVMQLQQVKKNEKNEPNQALDATLPLLLLMMMIILGGGS